MREGKHSCDAHPRFFQGRISFTPIIYWGNYVYHFLYNVIRCCKLYFSCWGWSKKERWPSWTSLKCHGSFYGPCYATLFRYMDVFSPSFILDWPPNFGSIAFMGWLVPFHHQTAFFFPWYLRILGFSNKATFWWTTFFMESPTGSHVPWPLPESEFGTTRRALPTTWDINFLFTVLPQVRCQCRDNFAKVSDASWPFQGPDG